MRDFLLYMAPNERLQYTWTFILWNSLYGIMTFFGQFSDWAFLRESEFFGSAGIMTFLTGFMTG